jgi:xylitol oxidase
MEFTPSAGAELQSEYFVALGDIGGVQSAVSGLRARIAPLLYISEVRTMRGDDLWLSMARGDAAATPRVAIHFTWRPLEAQVLAFLPVLEAALAPFHARPHWGKVFTMNLLEEGPRLYGQAWEDFKGLQRRVDPKGKFINPFLRKHFGV